MKNKGIGQRMKSLREACGLSQRELARRLKMHHSNITFWETSDIAPRGEVLPALAKELNTSVDSLLGVKPIKQREREPKGRLSRVFEKASQLPRRQQDKVAEFVEAFVNQQAKAA